MPSAGRNKVHHHKKPFIRSLYSPLAAPASTSFHGFRTPDIFTLLSHVKPLHVNIILPLRFFTPGGLHTPPSRPFPHFLVRSLSGNITYFHHLSHRNSFPQILTIEYTMSSLIATLLLVQAGWGLPTSQTVLLSPPVANQETGSLVWADCTYDDLPLVQCAELSVPLDWNNVSTSEKITLVLAKLPASGKPEEKLGSLVFNPGGPGGIATRGVAYYAKNLSYISDDVRTHFDISKWISLPIADVG